MSTYKGKLYVRHFRNLAMQDGPLRYMVLATVFGENDEDEHLAACWNLVEDFGDPADIRAVLEAVGVWRDRVAVLLADLGETTDILDFEQSMYEAVAALRKPAEEDSAMRKEAVE